MKATLSIFTALLMMAPVFGGNLHTFTSADGSKTMEASIENYDPTRGQATINIKGRKLKVPVTAFQKEDKFKFDAWYQASEAGRQLVLSFDEVETEGSEKKTSNAKITSSNSGFKIKVRNNGKIDFNDVKLQYRLFYYRDKAKGGKEPAYLDGDLTLSDIAPRETREFDTSSVELTRVRPLPASQCKGGG